MFEVNNEAVWLKINDNEAVKIHFDKWILRLCYT